jgi:galactokinase
MINCNNMKTIDSFLKQLYGDDAGFVDEKTARYARIDSDFIRRFGHRPECYVSTPGRTELGGNHTDHNHGRVLAAAIDLDMAAVAARNGNMTVTVCSEDYTTPFIVHLEELEARKKERGTTEAMIRGIAGRFKALGYSLGGFDAVLTSDVLPGSGLSSSAAVEVLLGTIFNAFFNSGGISSEEVAKIGQYAENEYFGKPCGLMDQMACAVGGIVAIDFQNPEAPEINKLAFDFKDHYFDLIILDTGGDHLDLTKDYTCVPAEMKAVAHFFGKDTLRNVSVDAFFAEIPKLRKTAGDRAVLRSLHFMDDNERVARQVDALSKNDMATFVRLVKESGDSSIKWLQNVYSIRNAASQGIPLALAMTEKYLSGLGTGACRVHGGGFAGSIQVLLPDKETKGYVSYIEKIFGQESARVLSIRSQGTCFFML